MDAVGNSRGRGSKSLNQQHKGRRSARRKARTRRLRVCQWLRHGRSLFSTIGTTKRRGKTTDDARTLDLFSFPQDSKWGSVCFLRSDHRRRKGNFVRAKKKHKAQNDGLRRLISSTRNNKSEPNRKQPSKNKLVGGFSHSIFEFKFIVQWGKR